MTLLVPEDLLAHLRLDGDRLAAAVERGPLDAPIAGCPGWDLRRLAAHVGVVHRWATQAVVTGESPSARPLDPDDGTDLAAWLRAGADALVTSLAAADPDAPTWHPFPGPKTVCTWIRRQTHETSVHRWDAEAAVGEPAPIDPALASDGIDEYFTVMLPRMIQRDALTVPLASLHVHCTDVAGEWLLTARGSGLHVERLHAKGDAALRGPAESLLLRLWGRNPTVAVEVVGDQRAADAWLALGGA